MLQYSQHDESKAVQMSQRTSKASLDKAAAEAQPLPLASQPAEARGEGNSSSSADMALIWTLQGPDGQPSRIGAHHFYGLQEKVGKAIHSKKPLLSSETCMLQRVASHPRLTRLVPPPGLLSAACHTGAMGIRHS